MTAPSPALATADPASSTVARPRGLLAACLAHALHDGYTDSLYAFLPIWQAQFGLPYAGLAFVRALYSGTMGGLQVPADRLLRGLSPRTALVLSTLLAATGLLIVALPVGFPGLCIGLVVAGVGSSIQHPRGSTLITTGYGRAARGPLGIYNFSGDLGKASLPALAAILLPVIAWRPVLGLMAALGVAVSMALAVLAPTTNRAETEVERGPRDRRGGGGGFGLLVAIGALDTATRMGYLLFLPFLIRAQHGGSSTIGVALALLFSGGALGKAVCGRLGQRLGVVGSVIATEAATALLIVATLFTPLAPTLVLLPLLGIVLNGTSSVLYGTVPDLATGDMGRAFALFYTSVIGSGGVAPLLYGVLADHSSRNVGVMAAAATAGLILPLALALHPHLRGATARGRTPTRETDP